MELEPCVHCKRHVGVTESACPFCATALPAPRSQLAFAGRLTRAALLSAAVVTTGAGCESKKPAPASSQQQGSAAPAGASGGGSADDLEKMLDADPAIADRPPLDAGAISDATALAATDDAGASADAGVDAGVAIDPAVLREKRKVFERHRDGFRKRELDKQKIRLQKPYGAPPARRRVV